MSDRYIRMGTERWKNPPSVRTWPWYVSQKGNWYTRSPNGRVAVIATYSGKFTFALSPMIEGERWDRPGIVFDNLEEAKQAAQRALGVSTKQPVTLTTVEPREEEKELPVRKIVLQ